MPWVRDDSTLPTLLRPRPRADEVLPNVVRKAYLPGVSMNEVADLLHELSLDVASNSQMWPLCREAEAESFRHSARAARSRAEPSRRRGRVSPISSRWWRRRALSRPGITVSGTSAGAASARGGVGMTATYGLIAVNFLVFFCELAVGTQGDGPFNRLINGYSLVPCEYTGHCAVYAGTPTPFWLTLFTSMFLHGGWAHILGNRLYLWVFCGYIERSMGRLRYLLFYLACGLGADALEIAMAANSNVPGLGASGAIAGVLGAYLVLYPRSTVRTLLPISWILIPLRVPAQLLIVGWFLLQLISGVASLNLAASSALGGVAYWAHVGSFVTGIPLVWPLRQPDRVEKLQTYLSI